MHKDHQLGHWSRLVNNPQHACLSDEEASNAVLLRPMWTCPLHHDSEISSGKSLTRITGGTRPNLVKSCSLNLRCSLSWTGTLLLCSAAATRKFGSPTIVLCLSSMLTNIQCPHTILTNTYIKMLQLCSDNPHANVSFVHMRMSPLSLLHHEFHSETTGVLNWRFGSRWLGPELKSSILHFTVYGGQRLFTCSTRSRTEMAQAKWAIWPCRLSSTAELTILLPERGGEGERGGREYKKIMIAEFTSVCLSMSVCACMQVHAQV